MPKNSRPYSNNSNYAVGYGRPPASSRFAAGTSGNPRGRPRRKEEVSQVASTHGELSMLHRAVLEAGAAKVEVKRGDRRVKVSAHAAVVGGLIESAWQGNTRAADMFLRFHQEAEELAQLQSVEAEESVADNAPEAARLRPSPASTFSLNLPKRLCSSFTPSVRRHTKMNSFGRGSPNLRGSRLPMLWNVN